jgi:4-amino-4-deoxy-L-arabinose transferase-like glycosyltransferase
MSFFKKHSAKAKSLTILIAVLIAFTLIQSYGIREPETRDYDESSFLCLGQQLYQGLKLGDGIFAHQPPVTFQLISLGFRLFEDPLLAGRVPILLTALLLIVAIFLVTKELFGWRIAGYSAPLAALFYPLLRGARIIQAEMPALALSTLAFYFLLRAQDSPKRNCLLAGALFMAGCLSKLLVAPYALAFLLILIFKFQNDALQLRPLKNIAHDIFWCLIGALTSALVILGRSDLLGLYNEAIGFHLGEARNLNFGYGADVIFLTMFISKFVYPWVVLAGVGLLSLSKQKYYLPLTVVFFWLIPSLAFLLMHQPIFLHHFAVVIPPIVIASAYGWNWIRQTKNKHLLIWAVVLILICSRTQIYSLLHYRLSADTQIALRTIERLTSPDDFVCSDRQLLPIIAGRKIPTQLCDTSHVRLRTKTLSLETLQEALQSCKLLILYDGRLSPRGGTKAPS